MRRLTLRQQPDGKTCMATSLAMILDMDVDRCIELYHDKLYSLDFWFDDIFDELDIPYEYAKPGRNTLYEGYVYLCSVPSLNNAGGMHQLVIDHRDEEYVVMDPNVGRGVNEYASDGFNLCGWRVDIILPSSIWVPNGNNDQSQQPD